jgi:hypothetical protein
MCQGIGHKDKRDTFWRFPPLVWEAGLKNLEETGAVVCTFPIHIFRYNLDTLSFRPAAFKVKGWSFLRLQT